MNEKIDVKKLRKEMNLSQVEFGKRVGADVKTVRKWERTGKIPQFREAAIRSFMGMPFVPAEKQETTPLYDVTATCGFSGNLSDGKPVGEIHVPNMPRCDGAIYVTGDSMAPVLSSGDIVAYKVVHDLDMINYGEIYIVQYEKSGDRTICVKYVKKSDDDKKLKLVSYNKDYDTIDINKKNVTYLAKVLFSIRQMAII